MRTKILLISYPLILIFFILVIIEDIFHPFFPEKHNDELYFNYKCKIVAIQDPIEWNHGKFRGIDKEWLLQSLEDTTLYTRYSVNNDSTWFNHKNQDTLHFDYIRKDRFFKINKK